MRSEVLGREKFTVVGVGVLAQDVARRVAAAHDAVVGVLGDGRDEIVGDAPRLSRPPSSSKDPQPPQSYRGSFYDTDTDIEIRIDARRVCKAADLALLSSRDGRTKFIIVAAQRFLQDCAEFSILEPANKAGMFARPNAETSGER